MFAEYMTIYKYTNNLIEKYPKQIKQVYDSQHRYAPTHTENGHFKILHARIHDYMFIADPIGHTANPCMVAYVYLDY